MGCDVLNLEWSSSGRDREVASLICYALRRRGYSVVEASIFNYKHYLLKYKPRLLYAADPKGARINYAAVKFAHKLAIPVVTFTAEGNYMPERIEEMFWGYISDRRLIERLNLQWSARARQMVIEMDPSLADQVKVCGSVGFDRYQIYRFAGKPDWMRKYRRNFARLVGYAGWGFDVFHRVDPFTPERERFYGRKQIEQFREEGVRLNEILRRLIEQNQDILFLLKEHPGVVALDKSELAGLGDYPNTLYVQNEEAIADCINGCDIWMAFESTTCLEAWLLGKPTLLINPFGGNFPRSNLHTGSPIFRTFEEVQAALKSYFENGQIPEFEAKQPARRQVIQDTIQWADGKNHLRAAYLIEQVLAGSPPRARPVPATAKIGAFWQNGLFEAARFLPKFRTYAAARARFRPSELETLTRQYEPYLESFHREHPLTEQDITELEEMNS